MANLGPQIAPRARRRVSEGRQVVALTLTTLLVIAVVALGTALFTTVATPTALLAVGMLAWSLDSAWFSPLPAGVGGSVGALLVGAAIFRARMDGSQPRGVPRIAWFPAGAAFVGLLLSPFALAPTNSARDAIEVMIMGLLVVLVARWVAVDSVVKGLFVGLTFPVLASAGLWITGISMPGAGLRFSGVTGNPNHLGILAFIWVALSFGIGRYVVFFTAPLGLYLVLLTGSRGSTLALVAALIAGFWVRSRGRAQTATGRIGRRLLIALTAGLVVLLVYLQVRNASNTDPALTVLRTDDSGRLDAAAGAWSLFQERPWSGYGFGVLGVEQAAGAHFWPVTIAVQMGVLGLALFGILLVSILRTPWPSSPTLAALVFSAIASWISESWPLGAGSMTTAAFWLAVASLASRPQQPASQSGFKPPARHPQPDAEPMNARRGPSMQVMQTAPQTTTEHLDREGVRDAGAWPRAGATAS